MNYKTKLNKYTKKTHQLGGLIGEIPLNRLDTLIKYDNLPEQINTAVGSYLIDDKLDIMNQTMLEATNKNTNTVINEDPDVKMGIGGKKGRKSRKLRKKMKLRGKSRRK